MVVLQSSAVKLSDVLPTCGVSAEWFLQQGPSHLLASRSSFLGFCFLAHKCVFSLDTGVHRYENIVSRCFREWFLC